MDNDDYAGGTSFCNSCRAGAKTNARLGNNENAELLQYYYHPDHLGSSSFITDIDGNVAQHVEYVPFGEVFLEEHNNTWQTPYLFNGKELDEETGLYYYGARYYDPKVSLFISHDPLAEKTGTPYQYCYQNPINLIDPTGMSAGPGDECEDCGGGWYYNKDIKSYSYFDEDPQSISYSYMGKEYSMEVNNSDGTQHYGTMLLKSDGSAEYKLDSGSKIVINNQIYNPEWKSKEVIKSGNWGGFMSGFFDGAGDWFGEMGTLFGDTIWHGTFWLETIEGMCHPGGGPLNYTPSPAGYTLGYTAGYVAPEATVAYLTDGVSEEASVFTKSIETATGGMKQWIRLGPSYSHYLETSTRLSLRWGASPRYAELIRSDVLRSVNQGLRVRRIPINSWRFKDAGHFHLIK